MRYLLIVATWLLLSALWGFVGAMFGPGIVMLIIAMVVGALGSIVMLIEIAFGLQVHPLLTGLFVTCAGMLLFCLLIVNPGMSWPASLTFAAFVCIQSFAVSLLVSRLRC